MPARMKYVGLARFLLRSFPWAAVPLRLSFGAWWLARDGALDGQLLEGTFETAELRFVGRFIQPDMIAVDIGAHHGLYTLLASKCVGKTGSVIAFEPSPRERKLLERHLRINFCSNVRVESVALGSAAGQADLFVVDGGEDGCNSLRPPLTSGHTHKVSVTVISLDEYLIRSGIQTIDFIKLDVEGAELDVLKGASNLLQSARRPVILAEVYDIRTKPWGYDSREIVLHLRHFGYRWHCILSDGTLREVEMDRERFDANLVAVPPERLDNVLPQKNVQSE